MNAQTSTQQEELKNNEAKSDRRTWEQSDWFRRWLELIRNPISAPAQGH